MRKASVVASKQEDMSTKTLPLQAVSCVALTFLVLSDYVNPSKVSLLSKIPVMDTVVTLLMPYTLPERLSLLSYLSEYFCLHDDEVDSQRQGHASEESEEQERKLARKALLGQIFGELMSISMPQAQNIARGLAAHTRMTAAIERESQVFGDFDEYIEFRYVDYASDFLLAATMFGMDMDPLTEHEHTIMDPLIRLAFVALSLTNDYYSFDVEHANTNQPESLVDGVTVLMRLRNLSVQEAKAVLRDIAIAFDQEFLRTWRKALDQDRLSLRLQKLTAALSHQMIGAVIWSSKNLRYDLKYRSKIEATPSAPSTSSGLEMETEMETEMESKTATKTPRSRADSVQH